MNKNSNWKNTSIDIAAPGVAPNMPTMIRKSNALELSKLTDPWNRNAKGETDTPIAFISKL